MMQVLMKSLEGTWPAARIAQIRPVLPGLALALVTGVLALALADGTGWPAMLMALIAGLTLGQVRPALGREAGVELSAKSVLRFGIVLLGARISVGQIAGIGWEPFATVLVALPATILCGVLIARAMGRGVSLGLLSGGAVAICGASAALAVSTVLPSRADADERLCGVIAVVTLLSSAAMIGYPVILGALGFSPQEIGVVLGATIHDVGQAVASGYSVSEEAGAASTIVKLSRVMLLPVVILALALMIKQDQGAGSTPFPRFVLGFLALVAINSLGLIPAGLAEALTFVSTLCLTSAIAAIGMKTRIAKVAGFGWQLPAILALETLFLVTLVTLIWL